MVASDHFPDLAARRALLSPEKPAFEDVMTGRSVTFGEFDRAAGRAARMLGDAGVEAGDRVAILCRNRIEFFELLFACARLGAVLVPLNWRMPAAELQPLIDDATPRLLFFGDEDDATAGALEGAKLERVALDGGGGESYAALTEGTEPLAGRGRWPAAECWYLLYTSGTTGKPKAVIQTYRMAIANYVNIRQAMSIAADDVTVNYLPLFHTAGINLVTLPTFLEGGLTLVLPQFDEERLLDLLGQGRLDTFFAVPAVYRQLSLAPRFDELDLTRVRSWGCGGAPMPKTLLQRYLDRGVRVCNGMGMTETGPTVFLMEPAAAAGKIGSVGKPQLLADVRIVTAEGRDAAPGEPGELWFAGPGISPGYWKNEEATRAAFTNDGWLRSGDIGRVDEDGFYFLEGRSKDMYISGGENVYPAEVENVLAGHPAVLEAAVVARADERWGEVGCAYLLPRPGTALPPFDELAAYCRARLAAYKVPRHWVLVDDFPRGATGKIQKHLLESA